VPERQNAHIQWESAFIFNALQNTIDKTNLIPHVLRTVCEQRPLPDKNSF